jgi:hypothetical protein
MVSMKKQWILASITLLFFGAAVAKEKCRNHGKLSESGKLAAGDCVPASPFGRS